MSRADGAEGGASTSCGELQCAGQLQRGSEGGAGTFQTRQRIRRGHINARRRQELVTRRQALHIHLSRRRNPLHSAILIQMTRNTHIYRVPCGSGFSGVGVRWEALPCLGVAVGAVVGVAEVVEVVLAERVDRELVINELLETCLLGCNGTGAGFKELEAPGEVPYVQGSEK